MIAYRYFWPLAAAILLSASSCLAAIAGGCTGCVVDGTATAQPYDVILISYLWRQAMVVAAFYVAGFWLGRRVIAGKMSASLSRKMICLLTFGISFANSLASSSYGPGIACLLVFAGCVIILLMLGSLCHFMRERVPVLRTVFAAINRPEDEPYTLAWLSTEAVVTSAIIAAFIPVIGYFAQGYVSEPGVFYGLMLIPIFASGIGDALAEIVGKRWGRHHYTTHAIFGKRTYTRSLEGSAMVFLTTVVVGLAVAFHFSFAMPVFFWKAMLLLPVTLTLAEAKAPHTWDNPLLYLVGYVTIIVCLL